ncbi:PEPxxWA-CTERM sorting domain-containing protein [Sphingomonas bacterium]|uniref:PEPxxWA-CTERM sorting domain-containing protein n=1 Tax=Sphingomonas bacterium TaxID=1895847 RepID=UPI001575FF2D|nr:PEPxxWA-CTERM sorting domain-containing protein [Sphingomonas bacterium]
MRIRNTLLAAAATMYVAGQADAQSAANISGAQLLLPLTTLEQTAAGRQALADNLSSTITVNNNASAARRQLAISDNSQFSNGSQFTNGLGTTLDASYQNAVRANDPLIAAITSEITQFTSVSGSDTSFGKYYFANGTTNGVTRASGPALPTGGQFNVYDRAYGVTTTGVGQDIYGDSRPFQVSNQIQVVSASINAGLINNPAFPSGHTTFGTTIALLEALAVPERFTTEIARGLDYGYSRVVLGAHYSFDVIAGRIEALHAVANLLNGNPDYTNGGNYVATLNQLTTNLRTVLSKYAGGTDVATAARQDTGQYSAANAAQVTSDANFRATYGVSATGPTNLAPVVPTGAEVLLSTRFTYLNAQQRRDVLASTELASGAALDDGSGWARLDLYTAGSGYRSFTGQTTINQDASQGGFAAADTFSNDIAGDGGFTHTGTGALTLTGANSYSGGTTVAGGTVIAGSQTALGIGDVTVAGGTLKIANALTAGGAYTQTSTGILMLSELGQANIFNILGAATLDGQLGLDLTTFGGTNGVYQLLGYGSHTGQFSTVAYSNLAGGETASLDYRANGLFLSLTGAVPEPATWMTMILGFGTVGGTLRRRRKRELANC